MGKSNYHDKKRFINIDNRLLGCIIPKGANSYLKCIAGYYKNGKWDVQTEGSVGDIYYDFNKNWKITLNYQDALKKDIRRFSVYREPFERFVSLYNEKIKCGHLLQDYRSAGLTQHSSFEDFLQFAEDSFIRNSVEYHLCSQSELYAVNDIDDIVMINDLDDYLAYYDIETPNTHINVAPLPINALDFDIHRHRIMALYNEDYKLLSSNKVWLRKRLPNINLAKNEYTPQNVYLEHIWYVLSKYGTTNILDLGSGNTTLLFRYYVNNVNKNANLLSVDHDCNYALNDVAMYEQTLNPIYSRYNGLVDDIARNNKQFDLISVDGPIGWQSKVPRIDVLDIITRGLLSRRFFIFIHDTNRCGEKQLLRLVMYELDRIGVKYYKYELSKESKATLITSLKIKQ